MQASLSDVWMSSSQYSSTDFSEDRIISGWMTFSTSPRFDFRFATGLVSRTTSGIVSGTAFVSTAIELNWRWKKPPKMVITGALHPSSIDNLKTGTLLGFHCDRACRTRNSTIWKSGMKVFEWHKQPLATNARFQCPVRFRWHCLLKYISMNYHK